MLALLGPRKKKEKNNPTQKKNQVKKMEDQFVLKHGHIVSIIP